MEDSLIIHRLPDDFPSCSFTRTPVHVSLQATFQIVLNFSWEPFRAAPQSWEVFLCQEHQFFIPLHHLQLLVSTAVTCKRLQKWVSGTNSSRLFWSLSIMPWLTRKKMLLHINFFFASIKTFSLISAVVRIYKICLWDLYTIL